MKYLKLFESYTKWYRGHTTKTRKRNYLWLTKSEKIADVYSIINYSIYGGEKKVSKYKVNLKILNILDLSEYDTDERLNEIELEDFLEYINFEYEELENLFDFLEKTIPLSRLLNKILDKIMLKYDGLKIKEDGIETLCINKKFAIPIKYL